MDADDERRGGADTLIVPQIRSPLSSHSEEEEEEAYNNKLV